MAIDLDATRARPIWDRAVDTSVVTVSTSHPVPGNTFDVRLLGRHATIVLTRTAKEHLLLSDGLQQLRVDVVEGSLLAGPVALNFVLPDNLTLPAQFRTIRRWQRLRSGWNFALIAERERRAPIWVRQLRAFDGAKAGATMRDIAGILFPALATPITLADRNSALRATVRRLLKAAHANVAGGYRRILGGQG